MQVEKLKTIDADTLLSTPIRKTLFVVDGLIPQGLSVLSGSSKIGKSWLIEDNPKIKENILIEENMRSRYFGLNKSRKRGYER